jgi:hypothetical protein
MRCGSSKKRAKSDAAYESDRPPLITVTGSSHGSGRPKRNSARDLLQMIIPRFLGGHAVPSKIDAP